MDLEYTSVYKSNSRVRHEIIQIGAIETEMVGYVNRVRKFNRLVKPNFPLTKKIIDLTSISNQDLKNEVMFPRAYNKFKNWLNNDDNIFIFWTENDISVIHENLTLHNLKNDIFYRYIDLQRVFMKHFKLRRQPSLKDALEIVGARFKSNEHDALNDAFNTNVLLSKIYWEVSILDFVKKFPRNSFLSTNEKGLSTFGKRTMTQLIKRIIHKEDDIINSFSFKHYVDRYDLDEYTIQIIKKNIKKLINEVSEEGKTACRLNNK